MGTEQALFVQVLVNLLVGRRNVSVAVIIVIIIMTKPVGPSRPVRRRKQVSILDTKVFDRLICRCHFHVVDPFGHFFERFVRCGQSQ